MKSLFSILVFALFFILSTVASLSAQSGGCGTVVTPEVMQFESDFQKRLKEQNTPLTYTPVTLSLTAHLVHQNDGTGGLSEQELNTALEKLNQDYEPAGIRFSWCIKHINSTNLYNFAGSGSQDESTFIEQHNVSNSLNIYFVDVPDLCGYAYFPTASLTRNQRHLIIMNVKCATNGSTLSHEVGHFFSLYHTHENAFGLEYVDHSNCINAGDLICDTPADPLLSYSNVTSECQYIGNNSDPKGLAYTPQVNNFMSYAVKECRNLFTPNQYERIRNGYDNYRTYLKVGNNSGGSPNTNSTDTLTVCAGQSITLEAPRGIAYYWSTGETTQRLTVTPTKSTLYQVVSEQIQGCPISKRYLVKLNEITLTSDKTEICLGSSAILTAQGGTDYEWSPAVGLDQTTGSTVKASPNITTTYTVKAKVGSCLFTNTITVSVELPKVELSSKIDSICLGNSLKVTAFGGSYYEWEPKIGVTLTGSGKYAILSPENTTTYTVTGFKDECSNTTVITVIIRANKNLKVNFTDTVVCYGEKLTLKVTGGRNYRWSPDGDLNNPTDSVIMVTAYQDKQYIVSSIGNACYNPITINIRIYQPMTVTVDRKPVSAPDASDGEITVHVKRGTPPYLYSLNGGAFQSDSTFKGLKEGLQKVVLKDGKGCEKVYYWFINAPGKNNCNKADFQWAKRAGGFNENSGNGVSTDYEANIYITGYFRETANFGDFILTSKGLDDVFVAKYDPNGNCLWAKRAGGEKRSDYGKGLSTDPQGNVYITGYFGGTADFGDFSLTSRSVQGGRERDIFLAKYDANGNCLWAKRAGGDRFDEGHGISIDSQGNVYITGYFESSTVDFGDFSLKSESQYDIFLAKYEPNGMCLWAKRAGANWTNYGRGVSTDFEGNVFITGSFRDTADFGDFILISRGFDDIFLAKYDPNGNCQWAKRAGSTEDDKGYGVTTDAQGNLYITGNFTKIADFDGFSLRADLLDDIFLAKYDQNGMCLWAKRAGGEGDDGGYGVNTDFEGNVYIAGYFRITADFGDFILRSKVPYSDVFLAKYDPNGICLWVKRAGGGEESDYGRGVNIDNNGNIYIIGSFTGMADFGNDTLKTKRDSEIFLAKLSCSGEVVASGCDFTATAGAPVSLPCSGGVRLTGGVSAGGTVYEWFPAEGLDDPRSLTPKASPKETTTYTLVAKKDTCTATAEVTVTVPKRQAFGLDTNRVAYCAGGSAQVFLQNADSLTFEFQPSEGINFTAPDKITVIATQTNVFQIIGKRDGYCDFVVDLTVVVHPQPSVFSTTQASDGGNNGKITASAADGTAPYQFALDGNNFTDQSIFENLPAGQHLLKVKDANGCQNQDTVWVEDCSLLSVNTGENVMICLGTSVEIKPVISPSNGFKSFLWLPTLGLYDPNALQVTASPISTTTYTLTVSNDQGCIGVDSFTVTVKQLPGVNAGTDASICPGESVSLSATSDAVIFRWSPETGLDNPTILNPKASPRKTTVYTLTADNGTCSTYDEVIVYVKELKIPSQEYICKNGSAVLDGGSGFDTYDWQPISGLSNTKIQKPTASPTQTTTYTLTVKKGICTLTDSVTVNVMQAQAIENQTLCTGNVVQLWAKGGIRYQWTPANGLSNPNSPYPVATPKVTTTYTVAVTDEFLCSDAVTVQVSVLSENSPLLAVDSVKEASCSGCIDGKIAVRVSGGLPPYQYSIDGGSFQPTGTFTGLGSGSYQVTVRDANGCLDDSLIRVMLLNTPCEIPTNLKVSASNTSARVSWQAVPKAQAYQVFYREIGIPAWREEITTDNFIVLQPLTSGKEYETYVISLCEDQVISPPSDTILFIPKNCDMKTSYTVQNISCTGKRNGSIRIDSISGGLPPYMLTFNGIPTDERVFSALTAGKYRIKTISSDGCTKEDTVTVGVEAGTDAPKIVMRNDTLFCQPAHFISYQWFRNGSSVSQNVRDAVHYTNHVAGSYVVRVQHSDTCIYRSEPFEYEYNSLQEVPETSLFEVYPNPFEDQTTIRFNANLPEQISIQVFDTRGALVYSRSEIDSGTTEVINLQLQTSGIYLLKIKAGSRIYTAKLVKF